MRSFIQSMKDDDVKFGREVSETCTEGTIRPSSQPNIVFLFTMRGVAIEGVSDNKDRPAFTATLKSHLSLSNGAAIKFDTVILNRGGGYNPKTGIFTAKKKGLYQISATIMSQGGGELICYIAKNGSNILYLYGPRLHGGSETANPVLELKKGDNVSVKSYGSQQINGDYFSYFSTVYISE